jgi:hypothetical protein
MSLTAAEFAEDLGALGDDGRLCEALLPGYDTALKILRREIVLASIADHGKVVERIAWRVDRVDGSNRGDRIDVPLVVLTISYHQGARRDRITLHLAPDALKDLREMCDRLM